MKLLSSLLVALAFLNIQPTEAAERQLYQYSLNLLNIPIAWGISKGQGTRVAIIDGGVSYHEEFSGYLGTELWKDWPLDDPEGHGTKVAGIIVSNRNMQGVAPEALFYSIKVYEASLEDDSFAWGINKAIDLGVDVINLSLYGGVNSTHYPKSIAALQRAISSNIIVVAAAGNNHCDCSGWIATFPGVVSVGSIDQFSQLSEFSNYGTWVDINAPGSLVVTTIPTNRYSPASGTSMSTPHISGLALLMKSVDKTLTPQRFKQIVIQTSTDKIANVGKAVYTLKGGFNTYFIPRVDNNVGMASTSTFR